MFNFRPENRSSQPGDDAGVIKDVSSPEKAKIELTEEEKMIKEFLESMDSEFLEFLKNNRESVFNYLKEMDKKVDNVKTVEIDYDDF